MKGRRSIANGSGKKAQRHRQRLANRNTTAARAAYWEAKRQGKQDPVVLVLDLNDRIARMCATGLGMSDAQIRDMRAAMKAKAVPTVIGALPRNLAIEFWSESGNGAVGRALMQPQLGRCDVVVVAARGNRLVRIPEVDETGPKREDDVLSRPLGGRVAPIWIPRRLAEQGGPGGIETALKVSRLPHEQLGKVTFIFEGYDDDERELWEIPEVCEFVKALLVEDPASVWPYLLKEDVAQLTEGRLMGTMGLIGLAYHDEVIDPARSTPDRQIYDSKRCAAVAERIVRGTLTLVSQPGAAADATGDAHSPRSADDSNKGSPRPR